MLSHLRTNVRDLLRIPPVEAVEIAHQAVLHAGIVLLWCSHEIPPSEPIVIQGVSAKNHALRLVVGNGFHAHELESQCPFMSSSFEIQDAKRTLDTVQ